MMDYLDFERIVHLLMCIFTVMLGIGLAILCILYEKNIKLTEASNITDEMAYVFPYDTWHNITG